MIVNEKDFKNMIKNINGTIFKPAYKVITDEEIINSKKTKKYSYEILKTTEEVYQEYIENKNNPPKKEPTKEELLQKQLLETQNLVLELQYKLTNKDLEIK